MRVPVPSVNKTYTADFRALSGGLNLLDLNYQLKANESPDCVNVWYQDGVIQSRDGQVYLSDDASLGLGFACSDRPFHGSVFFHIGAKLYAAAVPSTPFALTEVYDGLNPLRGTFVRYGDALYYKNRGAFVKISHDSGAFTAAELSDSAYVPVILLNADPETGGGDLYQPENRLSASKIVRYSAKEGVTEYHLPVGGVESVASVKVDGVTLTPGSGYTVDNAAGLVIFADAPPVTDPPSVNTVEIEYVKRNTAARSAIMDCSHAVAAGEGRGLCLVLGGCPSQPNAVFWNANDSYGMNDTYFPVDNYQLCGGAEDPVTGFGLQYDDLILFRERSLGKLTFSVERVEERDNILFTYQQINAKIGCDLPRTIQLVENNLVFCNRKRGVWMLTSSSAAYENNVVCLSDKVNGDSRGLLSDVRTAPVVCSADDGKRYWLCGAEGCCYVWDYEHSAAGDPSWFYLTNVRAADFFEDEAQGFYHLGRDGTVTRFGRTFSDYGEPIEKRYTLPTQYFGGYERLKDVTGLIVVLRGDTGTTVELDYETDYETRRDRTPIQTGRWSFLPRNLAFRDLRMERFSKVAKRRPGCRHIRHFSLTLTNNGAGEDLALVSAQIFYRYTGKER